MIKKILVLTLACISSLIAQHRHKVCQNPCNHSYQHNKQPHHPNPCSHSQIHKYQKVRSVQTASGPHAARMNKYDVKHYFLDIALERTSTYISGSVSILGQVTASQIDTFSFQLHQDLTIDSVKINGLAVPVVRSQGEANALLSTPLGNGSLFEAKIWYKGTPPSGQSAAIGNGISNGTSQSWGNQITWTLSQPYAAYEWFPCKQILSDKADSVTVWVTTSTSNKVGSNGLLQNITSMPNNKHRYEWKSHYPIDYYLISITVGQYVEYNIYAKPQNYPDSILIQNYIYNNPNTLPYFQNEINKTKNLVELYSNLFGLYPFHIEKYGHCMAPFSGGMEHQTMTSQGFFTFTLTAHELAHQWFGDYVTCDTWSDIWLNEGFASYSEYLALEHLPQLGNETAADWMSGVHDNVMSQNGGSVFVADTTNVNRIFSSRLTYDKGAAILHTLRFLINNDSLFFQALRNYLQQHAFATATVQDFKASVENTTNLNLQQFFQQWYYGEGYPTFNVRWLHLNNQLIMQVTQSTSTTVTPLFITPIEYKIIRPSGGDTIIRLNHTQQVETYYIPLQGTVSNIIIDPSNWILNKGTVIQDPTLSLLNTPPTQSWNIYPNPTQQSLHIQGTYSGFHTLTIYDTNGKLLLKQHFIGQNHTIDLSQWIPGTYILNIQNDHDSFSTKFQKF